MIHQLAGRIRRATVSTDRRKSLVAEEDLPPSPNTAGNYADFFIPPLEQTPLPHRVDGIRSTAYLIYDLKSPPPRPFAPHTRFVCISDTHSQAFDVPPGDVLLHSGDLTKRGRMEHFQTTLDWLCSLPHKLKMCVVFWC